MRQWGEKNLHLSAEQIGERGPATTIRHMNHVDPGHILYSSPETWFGLPLPGDAMLSLRGLALA